MSLDPSALLGTASQARQYAYAPYSKFLVGAALLSPDGRIFSGCNVENASYGLTICAERTAVFKAVSVGIAQFQAMALSIDADTSPCGACRQVLFEFAPNLPIYIGNANGTLIRETSLDILLPQAFDPSNLQ